MKKVLLLALLALGAIGCKKDELSAPVNKMRNVTVQYDGDLCPSFIISLSNGDTLLNTSLSGDTLVIYHLESTGEMNIHIGQTVPTHTTSVFMDNPLVTYVSNGTEILVYM